MTTIAPPPDDVTPRPAVAGSTRPVGSLALRGSAWVIVGYGSSQVLRLASSLILTRLLFPEAFGLTALIAIFQQGLEMFSDLGIGPSIIQNRRGDDPAFLDTAWTIQVLRGSILWLASVLIAWPIAQLYGAPVLTLMLPVAGLTALIQGFNSTALYTARRHLAVGKITLLELFVQVVTIVAIVGFALIHASAWDITIGNLVGAGTRLVLSYVLFPGRRNRFRWEPEARDELIRFGRWIFVSTMLTFCALQIDRLLLGKLVSLRELGIYTLAASLAQMPRGVIQRLVETVVYPLLSRLDRSTADYFAQVRGVRRLLLLLSGLACGFLIVAARPLIDVVYDARYRGAAPLLEILLFCGWLETLSVSYGSVLLASGRPKPISIGVALRIALFLAAAWPAFDRFGVRGIAGATAVGELGVLAVCMAGARRIGVLSIRQDLAQIVVAAAFFTFMLAVREACRAMDGTPLIELGLLAFALSIILSTTVLATSRRWSYLPLAGAIRAS